METYTKEKIKKILDELYHNTSSLNEMGRAYNQAIQDIAKKLKIELL